MTEHSLVSNEIPIWTQIMEPKNNDKIEKVREEMVKKFEAFLKEVKTNKTALTMRNPRSESNEIHDSQPSGSYTNRSIGVHASNFENSDSENVNYPLRASKMSALKHPAKPLFQTSNYTFRRRV